ncbi:hypothetical protein ACHAXH_005783, partial [Discostella pseudostelligera]
GSSCTAACLPLPIPTISNTAAATSSNTSTYLLELVDAMSTDGDGSNVGSLPRCAICHINIAIYRCPRCACVTCSLECCRAHKVKVISSSNNNTNSKNELICNGKRDRTQFCSLKGFTDSQLSSDYHFLEDVLKVSDRSKRLYHGIVAADTSSSPDASRCASTTAKRARGPGISNRVDLESISTKPHTHPLLRAKEGRSVVAVLAHGVDDNKCMQLEQNAGPEEGIITELLSANKKPATTKPLAPQNNGEKVDPLVRQAEVKGVNLLRMPCGMMRRTSNTTKFNKKKGTIAWRIELVFHLPKCDINEEGGESIPSCPSGKVTIPKHVMIESELSEQCTLSNELGKHLDVHPGNSATRSRLRAFVNTPRDSLSLLMKRIPCSSAAPKYFKLDPNSSLAEALEGKTIIEFPTIDVVLESDKERFPLFIDDFS